jgi:hypothetical protein
MNQKIQPLTKLLSQSLSKFQQQPNLLEQANRLFSELLPARLATTYQIALIKQGEIVITTTNPELRYALNQFSHDFIRKLQKLKSFAHINKINIKIDPQLNQLAHSKPKSIGSHLAKAKKPSKQSAQLIQQISESIADSELANALSKLAKLAE